LRVLIGPLFGIVSGTFLNFLIINLATNIAYIANALNLPVLYTFRLIFIFVVLVRQKAKIVLTLYVNIRETVSAVQIKLLILARNTEQL